MPSTYTSAPEISFIQSDGFSVMIRFADMHTNQGINIIDH